MRHVFGIFFATVLMVTATAAGAETAPSSAPADVPFESDAWTVTAGRVVEHLGRQALAGSAHLQGLLFADGVIEVDMAVDGRRCFPGILFRAASEADTETFYIRPHRSKNYSHALQYAPRFRGSTGWQLYSGPGFTAGADIPLDRWVTVRLEISGTRARIYFDDMQRPALVVDDLKRGSEGGFVGLTAPPDGRAHFSNFRYSTDAPAAFGPEPIRAKFPGAVESWQLSRPVAPADINRDLSPAAQDLGDLGWRATTADPSGLVDISRVLPEAPRLPACVVARTRIEVPKAGSKKLVFGYSDEISIFLNGKLLFRGDSTFRVRDSEFMGVIGYNDAVVLDLKRGFNELAFVLTESFGGWGFMARLEDLRSAPVALADGVSRVWTITEGLAAPESAAWDAKRARFYVSNTGSGGETGFVSLVAPSGEVIASPWVGGLRTPTGTALAGDRLYVVERTGVAEIDVEAGTIAARHSVPAEGGFLNDLAVAEDGALYVSDSRLGLIHRIRDGESCLWLEGPDLAGVNGLLVRGDRLFAATFGSEALLSIDLESATIETIVTLRPFGGDGIVADGEETFLVSDFLGLLLRVTEDGDREVLVDSRDAGISLTDFGYAPELGLVLIPTLRGNSLIAFKLTRSGP